MLLLNFFLQVCTPPVNADPTSGWLKTLVSFAPLLSFLAAFANLCLAIYIFKFSRRKNDSDRNVKWFQELVYTPNKEVISLFFRDLHSIKDRIPAQAELDEGTKIYIMTLLKAERNKFFTSFVDLVKPIAPDVHTNIKKAVDDLIDSLTKTFDNDELKLNNDKTYQREITNRITTTRNSIMVALFNYRG